MLATYRPRTAVAGASRGGRSARLADDQRDVASGAALVTAVTGIGGYHPGPQLRLLLWRRPAGPHRAAPAGHGQLDVRVSDQVAVPVRVAVIAALGGHQHHPVPFDDRSSEHGR